MLLENVVKHRDWYFQDLNIMFSTSQLTIPDFPILSVETSCGKALFFFVSTASEELVSDWQSLPWCLAQEHPESSQIWQKPTWVCELCARGLIAISPRKSNLLLHRMTWQLTRNTRSSMVVVWQVVLSAFAISSSLCSFVWISTTFLPPPTSWLTSGLI